MAESYGPTAPKTPHHDDKSEISHPYKEFEGSPHWTTLNTALNELKANGDIEETTNRVYIVGYLCQALAAAE